jgi:AraC family transcriptional regulator, regulatory protein of adaptative response / DNA-3-methyladenine glycosylase II
MNTVDAPLSANICQKARIARDARFDGRFFVAVKTTGIFCRPICPAVTPKEGNVEYYMQAIQAARAGFRPCLRCRPDSAPDSCAWKGTDTTVNRAVKLIDAGALSSGSLDTLAERLGITSRYLRKLFTERLGTSPKAYALFQQVMFAKQLLHETALPITEVACTAGFNSVRRFNDAFQRQLNLKPSDIRRHSKKTASQLQLTLAYRPPLDWQAMLDFWRMRAIDRLEWVEEHRYGRSYRLLINSDVNLQSSPSQAPEYVEGYFEVSPCLNKNTASKNALTVTITIDRPAYLRFVVNHIRKILDLDTDIDTIERDLKKEPAIKSLIKSGIRIPGIWHPFEAGVRAILGQQVSVAAARTHVQRLVAALGLPLIDNPQRLHFPTPQAVAQDALEMLKLPARRRQTVHDFARWYSINGEQQPVDQWLSIKGIGPWTVEYVKLRALGDPDIWLAGDLGIKKAVDNNKPFDSDNLTPWRSYATFQLWRSLS